MIQAELTSVSKNILEQTFLVFPCRMFFILTDPKLSDEDGVAADFSFINLATHLHPQHQTYIKNTNH